ncbi:hypothetical protein PybrP1_005607 [[Pythium] brassicae (nom. inval.)]|nr:hypothetical protein PybrP1_005607 [[Pythium] brassicae (nom. inval.)]
MHPSQRAPSDHAARANYAAADASSSSDKQASGYDDTLYPSFQQQQQFQHPHYQQQPSAPLLATSARAEAVPLYCNSASEGQQYIQQPPQQQQYSAQYGYPAHPPAPVYPPQFPSPVRSGDYRRHGCVGTTLKLMIFHFFNAVLGIAAFVLVITGVHLSIGLLPLCCFGILVFRGVLCVVGWLAKLDVKLYNYISPASEHVFVDIPQEARFFGLAGQRLSPKLSSFSPLALMAALYFCTIKFAVGILSCIVVSTVGALFVMVAAVLADSEDLDAQFGFQFGGDDETVNIRDSPVQFALVWVCVLVISVALMHLVARLSRASTRFFCCEKFSTYRYVHTAQYPHPVPQVAMASGGYGTYARA